MSNSAARAALAALIVTATCRTAAAQACAGHPIRRIGVITSGVLSIEGHRIPKFVQGIANALSWQTHPVVVRRELRFAEGEICDPARLVESVRVLRSQRYIRTAEMVAVPAPGDSVDILVGTNDEWALGGSIRISPSGSRAFKALRITENDLLGRGMLAQLNYEYLGRHPGIVLDVLDRQFLGGRSDMELVGGRSSVGPVGEVSWRRSFESEYDRIAWRAAVRYRDEPFSFSSSVFGSVRSSGCKPLKHSG